MSFWSFSSSETFLRVEDGVAMGRGVSCPVQEEGGKPTFLRGL